MIRLLLSKDQGRAVRSMGLNDIKDEKLKAAVIEELNKRKKRRKILTAICIILAVGSLGYFGVYTYMEQQTNQMTSAWSELKDISKKRNADTSAETSEVVVHKTTDDVVIPDVLPEYVDLKNQNQNLVGWVKVADTKIDYPVLQTVDNEYYLTHNFNQGYDKNGCIFLDTTCDLVRGNTNWIIYGHHMKSGNMFGELDKYADESFYLNHKTFTFDTIYEKGTYEVCYVFRSQVYAEDEITFKYYQFIDVNSENEFYSAISEMANMSLYVTGVTPAYGDQLVTLSTCDHSETAQGRFVVVGRKVG